MHKENRANGALLKIGLYRGHVYAVKLNYLGYYCGYVRVKKYENYVTICNEDYQCPITCHGGITFTRYIRKQEMDSFKLPPGYWIGFDAAHVGDYQDLMKAREVFGLSDDEYEEMRKLSSSFKIEFFANEKNMIEECEKIIDQLLLERYDDK